MKPEWICGLPFYTVSNERMTNMTNMTIGEIVEDLIRIKGRYNIGYPDDEAINNACNILDKLPKEKSVYEWIKEN